MRNAERIRDAFDAIDRGDPYPFLEMYAPDIELYVRERIVSIAQLGGVGMTRPADT